MIVNLDMRNKTRCKMVTAVSPVAHSKITGIALATMDNYVHAFGRLQAREEDAGDSPHMIVGVFVDSHKR